MSKFTSHRRFRVWDYKISLSQLLIRSPSDAKDSEGKNIDIIFKSVKYMSIPVGFVGLDVDEPTDQEMDLLRQRSNIELINAGNCIVLSSAGIRYFIIADYHTIQMNELAPMMSSLESF